jgi:hypothetical protein
LREILLVRKVDEFLRHLLLEVELRIQLLQRGDRFLECLELFLVDARRAIQQLAILIGDRVAQFLHLLAQARQHLHVALAALDLLVENHAIEALAAVGQLVGQIQVRLGDEAEAVDQPLHHRLGFFDALRDFDFLLAREQRDLAHLLQIHAHRVVEDIELRLGLLLFLFFAVLLAVLVAIDFRRLNDVDFHAAQPRQDRVELVCVGDLGG